MGRLRDALRALRLPTDGVSAREMTRQTATAVEYSGRSPWSDNPSLNLTPERLATILHTVRSGELPDEYLELAQEIERREAHYRSVLSVRKQAVERLDVIVTAGGEGRREQEIADAVRGNIVRHEGFPDLVKNALDALGKGFSVHEVIWDATRVDRWFPAQIIFRDPRWFAYRHDDQRLSLRAPYGNELTPLPPFAFLVHEPNLLAGPQIVSGLAYTAMWLWMTKSYDIASWAAFVDRFGYPVRVGKYGRKASKEDITTLKRAVAAIGSDVGAVIPDSMMMEIIETKTAAGAAGVYERLATWSDGQMSKLVLGQTMTSDDGSSRSQAEVHNQVRQDIIDADGLQLAKSLNRDLVRPFVALNYGPQERYPSIALQRVDAQDVKLVADALSSLVPLGLRVRAEEVRGLLGLSHPEEDDEVLELPSDAPAAATDTAINTALAINAAGDGQDALTALLDDAADDWQEITDDLLAALDPIFTAASDYDDLIGRLQTALAGWSPGAVAELVASVTFKARAHGVHEFDR